MYDLIFQTTEFELLVHRLVQELFILVLSTLSIYLSISYHTNFLFKMCMKWSYTLTPPPPPSLPKNVKKLGYKKKLKQIFYNWTAWSFLRNEMHGLFIINDSNRFTSQSEVIYMYFSKCESHKNASKLTNIPHITQKLINIKQ